MSNGSKERILGKIRAALRQTTPQPFEGVDSNTQVYRTVDADLAVSFAENFVQLQGQFSYCLSMQECKQQLALLFKQKNWKRIFCEDLVLAPTLDFEWYADLKTCDASITTCEALVARTGSMVLSSAKIKGRTSSVYSPVHICIAYTSQLVPDVSDALALMNKKYGDQLPSFISFASGPSRTADIEKTLVTGVHGPKEVFCFLVED